jgi:hypothetical protein
VILHGDDRGAIQRLLGGDGYSFETLKDAAIYSPISRLPEV